MRVAITGSNAGIGLRAVARLASAGHEVVALCRDIPRGEKAIAGLDVAVRPKVQLVQLDLASSESIRAAAEVVVAGGVLDAVINNAAVFDQTIRTARQTADGRELFWATNHLGPTEFTARVSSALAASRDPRIVFVASKGIVTMPRIAIRYDALDGNGWFSPARAYYHSKLAQIMTAMTIAEHVGEVVDVSCLRVPAVRLDADRLAAQPAILRALYAPKNRMAMSPEALAEVYARLLLEPARHAGADDVYVDEAVHAVSAPRFARDPKERERLWRLTNAEIGAPAWAWPALSSEGASA